MSDGRWHCRWLRLTAGAAACVAAGSVLAGCGEGTVAVEGGRASPVADGPVSTNADGPTSTGPSSSTGTPSSTILPSTQPPTTGPPTTGPPATGSSATGSSATGSSGGTGTTSPTDPPAPTATAFPETGELGPVARSTKARVDEVASAVLPPSIRPDTPSAWTLTLSGTFPVRSARLMVSIGNREVGPATPLPGERGAWLIIADHSVVTPGAEVTYRYEGSPSTSSAGILRPTR